MDIGLSGRRSVEVKVTPGLLVMNKLVHTLFYSHSTGRDPHVFAIYPEDLLTGCKNTQGFIVLGDQVMR
jgi:hypothetical protein